jgi:tetratricopeptide (TPR) repeat protein
MIAPMNGTAPERAATHIEAGNAHFARGDAQGAIECYRAALAEDPASFRAHLNLGIVLAACGRRDEAIRQYARALQIAPDSTKALVNLGNAEREAGNAARARELYARALSLDPDDVTALVNLGSMALEEDKLAEAERFYRRAAELGSPDGHHQLARMLHRVKRFDEAASHFASAFAARPKDVASLLGWAHSVNDRGDRAAAAPLYRHVLELDPANLDALNNLASHALDTGKMEEAADMFSRVLHVQPGHEQARYNLAMLALRRHDFSGGWPDYELRLRVDAKTTGLAPTRVPRLSRNEIPMAGPVAVRKEQGLGDQLVFSTVLPDLVANRIQAVVEADPRLIDCFRRSIPGIEFVTPDEARFAFEQCAREIPLGSLPGIFRTALADFERSPKALLAPRADRVATIDRVLPAHPRIAISWRSFQIKERSFITAAKSAMLDCFAHFADLGAHLVDVQYGDAREERIHFDERYPGLRVEVPGLDIFTDLEGVLAALECCDLVITTSNVTAHLAGAIGKRTWLVYLAANPPFHYWAPGPDGRSLWYPSVEVLTDASWTDWNRAFEAVALRWRAGQGG